MQNVAFAVVPFCLCLVSAQAQIFINTPLPVTIDEARIRASLQRNSTIVSIPIRSSLDHAIRANLSLEWIAPNDAALGSADRDLSIDPGRTTVDVPLRLPVSSVWLRLRYTLTPHRDDARAFTRQSGVLSLPHIADHVFELKVSYAGAARSGGPVIVYAQAIHPVTRATAPDVEWKATLAINGDSLKPAKIVKHPEGVAELTFQMPAFSGTDEDGQDAAEVTVTGRRGDFEQAVRAKLFWQSHLSARLQTDKPIYQPGQTIHIRALVTDPQGRAAEGAKVNLRITESYQDRVHSAQLVSSRFGIVNEDWSLPATAQLGDYQIVLTADGDNDYQLGNHRVRVSRYELPEFTVTAKPDRAAYLPGQEPALAISGAYLFGKPVPKGKVKVTRSGEARFNPKTRRSETVDQTVAEGEAGDDGVFLAHLDLSADHKDLNAEQRFEDLHFAACYTDPLSKRTEQRRFDIRITREPIHVYVIRSGAGGRLPAPVYVSTDYADGRPASANVEIDLPNRTIAIQTNRYGVGKAYLTPDDQRTSELKVRAVDVSGQTGTWVERFWHAGSEQIRLESGRTLYRAGESVALRIAAPPGHAGNDFVVLNAIAEGHPVARQVVRLANGEASAVFPWQPEFRRTLVFEAWSGDDQAGAKAVIFPDGSDLRVTTMADRTLYRPGEKSTLRIRVTSADGKPAEAAVGLAVVDQAVLERARTDSEFGRRPWFACAFCGDPGEVEIGGVRLNDLYSLKPSATISPELDLVAESLVAHAGTAATSESGESIQDKPPFSKIDLEMKDLQSTLDLHHAESLEYPGDSAALAGAAGLRWTALRDPWGLPYTARFTIERDWRVVEIISSGPDKKAGTDDDFVAGTIRRPYFDLYAALIKPILAAQDDYPATEATFREALHENGLLFDTMRDPWGTPYRARVSTNGPRRLISIESAGPDRKFGSEDDFSVATFSGSYFERERSEIVKALQDASTSPQTLEEFQHILTGAGMDVSLFRDAWGRPYRLITRTFARYADKVDSTTLRTFGNPGASIQTTVTPVTQRVIAFALRSAGPDGVQDTYDDFDIASFPIVLKEDAVTAPAPAARSLNLLKGTGTIFGVVTDPTGVSIPNAQVTLTDGLGNSNATATAEDGTWEFNSVPAGVYSLRAISAGFMSYTVEQVPVKSGKAMEVNMELQLGTTAEQVTVDAAAVSVNTTTAEISSGSVATPRVREYFPETLLWMPEIITDAGGKASTQFVLADSVTTWKIAVIASTMDGRVAEAESDLRTFQSFFLAFNPPSVLTDGDRLEMPVTVHNYQDREQKIALEAHANEWISVDGARTKQVQAPANNSVNVAWAVVAKGITDAAPQRISAAAGRNRDAIEKSVRIHPDGQEVTQTQGDLFAGRTGFSVSIPPMAITGATRAELRLYPNVASMLLESAAAILETPHGCAEQNISAGYANLIALRYAKAVGMNAPRIDKRAMTNIGEVRDNLAAFIDASGGVSYWGTGAPDVALTAYAIDFLLEASALPPDQEELRTTIQTMVQWLQERQKADGAWASQNDNSSNVSRQEVLLTSLVVRSLAAAEKAGFQISSKAMAAAYHHIASLADQIDEPYMLAQFILAALDSGDQQLLGDAGKRLLAAGHDEAGGMYWDLRTNSPFHGWGTAGRFETTALVVSALAAWRSAYGQSTELDASIRRGLVFLLRGRDRYGSWFSTQSTVRAMKAIADASPVLGIVGGAGGTIEIRSNGRVVKTVPMPAGARTTDPILIDASSFLTPGDNRLELATSSGQGSVVLMRFASSYWLPWTQTKPRTSPELRLAVQFDRQEAKAGEPVRCSVKAERVGFRGYGMMLAEIGLPPGAEVDRASLESVVDNVSLGIDRYEVLPDRVVFYLWPRAGGASFEFFLRTRIPMLAKSTSSVLYDYYNPEALSEVVPVEWRVN